MAEKSSRGRRLPGSRKAAQLRGQVCTSPFQVDFVTNPPWCYVQVVSDMKEYRLTFRLELQKGGKISRVLAHCGYSGQG